MSNMGPVHHREIDDDTVTEGIEGSIIDSTPSISRCSTPDNEDDLCIVRQNSIYTGQHKAGRKEQDSDAWIGYHQMGWASQEYSPHHPSRQVLNILHQQQQQQQQHQQQHQQQQQQHHMLSQSSPWQSPTSMSSLLRDGSAFTGGATSTDNSSYPKDDSVQPCDAQSRSMTATRRRAIPQSSGLLDLQSLPVTTPVTRVACVPLPTKCVTDAIDMNYQELDTSDPRGRSLLKRKFSLTKSESASSSSPKQIHLDDSMQAEKKKRFARTTEALKKLGLWEIAMRTGEMIIQNRTLQQELNELRQESKQLMLSVLKNPENNSFKQALLTMQAQFYARKHKSFENHNISIKSS